MSVFCKNCRSNVPTPVWELHETTCERHRWYCDVCEQPFPKNDREQHNQNYHAMIPCECGEKVEVRKMADHKKVDCSRRLIPCMYCDCPTFHCELQEHEFVCGSRTEPCEYCKKRFRLSNLTHICEGSSPPLPVSDNEYLSPPSSDNENIPLSPIPIQPDDLVICPFCMTPATDYTLLQVHIFNDHPEVVK